MAQNRGSKAGNDAASKVYREFGSSRQFIFRVLGHGPVYDLMAIFVDCELTDSVWYLSIKRMSGNQNMRKVEKGN